MTTGTVRSPRHAFPAGHLSARRWWRRPPIFFA